MIAKIFIADVNGDVKLSDKYNKVFVGRFTIGSCDKSRISNYHQKISGYSDCYFKDFVTGRHEYGNMKFFIEESSLKLKNRLDIHFIALKTPEKYESIVQQAGFPILPDFKNAKFLGVKNRTAIKFINPEIIEDITCFDDIVLVPGAGRAFKPTERDILKYNDIEEFVKNSGIKHDESFLKSLAKLPKCPQCYTKSELQTYAIDDDWVSEEENIFRFGNLFSHSTARSLVSVLKKTRGVRRNPETGMNLMPKYGIPDIFSFPETLEVLQKNEKPMIDVISSLFDNPTAMDIFNGWRISKQF